MRHSILAAALDAENDLYFICAMRRAGMICDGIAIRCADFDSEFAGVFRMRVCGLSGVISFDRFVEHSIYVGTGVSDGFLSFCTDRDSLRSELLFFFKRLLFAAVFYFGRRRRIVLSLRHVDRMPAGITITRQWSEFTFCEVFSVCQWSVAATNLKLNTPRTKNENYSS